MDATQDSQVHCSFLRTMKTEVLGFDNLAHLNKINEILLTTGSI